MLNLIIGELKQILESCGVIIIKDNNIQFVIYIYIWSWRYYSWSIFHLENSLFGNYFTKKMSVTRFNKYQRNMAMIVL